MGSRMGVVQEFDECELAQTRWDFPDEEVSVKAQYQQTSQQRERVWERTREEVGA